MGQRRIEVSEFSCERCGHKWISRLSGDETPLTCPSCRSAYWNRPRQRPAATRGKRKK